MIDNQNDLTSPVGQNDHLQGHPDAAIQLVEYGDFECIHCRRASGIIRKIQRHLGPDLCFVFRSFPLSESHPHANHAAQAAEIAAENGRFWEYHDQLYSNQEYLDDQSLVSYATDLGLNGHEFEKKLREERYHDTIQEIFIGGVESGVNGTPSFFVNGSRYDGSWEYEPFMEYLSGLR